MTRPGVIKVSIVTNGWKYENVYADTEEHKGNLDVYFYKDGELVDMILDTHHVIIPDKNKLNFTIAVHKEVE